VSDRRSRLSHGCPRSYSGKHRWIDEQGAVVTVAPTVVGVHVHLCQACGRQRQVIVGLSGDRQRKYTDAGE
jgi:hypothetical protein